MRIVKETWWTVIRFFFAATVASDVRFVAGGSAAGQTAAPVAGVPALPPRAERNGLRAEELPTFCSAVAKPQMQRSRADRGRAERLGRDRILVGHSAEAPVQLHFELDLPPARVRRNPGVRDERTELPHRKQ